MKTLVYTDFYHLGLAQAEVFLRQHFQQEHTEMRKMKLQVKIFETGNGNSTRARNLINRKPSYGFSIRRSGTTNTEKMCQLQQSHKIGASSYFDNKTPHSQQGLTNPLPGRPGQAPNWAWQVLFPAQRPAGQVIF